MGLLQLAERVVNVQRQTTFVLDSTTALATMSLDRQPVRATLLEFGLSGGTANTGTVAIAGTDPDGNSISETLTFTGAGFQTTTRRYATVDASGITTTGLTDESTVPTIEARQLGRDGSPQTSVFSLITGLRIHLEHSTPSWRGETSGSSEQMGPWAAFEFNTNYTPREGDVLVDERSQEWVVVGTPEWLGSLRHHHWEVQLKRRQGTV